MFGRTHGDRPPGADGGSRKRSGRSDDGAVGFGEARDLANGAAIERTADGSVAPAPGIAVCRMCPHACRLREGQRGRCRARVARGGKVVCENYGRVTALALDPIEKKPLARFRPGARVLSVGSYGCNLRCPFCQNASIAAQGAEGARWREISPEAIVAQAVAARADGNVGVAFTYNEPLVGFEYVRDAARLAKEAGLAVVLVTNGMVNPGPLSELLPLVDAANVDLKGFSQDFYDRVGGDLATVKATIEAMAECPTCHVEVTTLIVPGMNDREGEIDALAAWLASFGRDIPYHVSRFFPCHRMADAAPTPVRTVNRLAEVARRHLDFVYTGNC